MKLLVTAWCLLTAAPAAKQCFYDVVNAHREQELIDSEIELNKQKAEWYRRHKNDLNYHGFPCERGL